MLQMQWVQPQAQRLQKRGGMPTVCRKAQNATMYNTTHTLQMCQLHEIQLAQQGQENPRKSFSAGPKLPKPTGNGTETHTEHKLLKWLNRIKGKSTQFKVQVIKE
jgi:hypothetical protein